MPNQDFLRRLPESDQALRRRDRLQQRIHVDFWLLLLLLTITAGGLVVLFSASDQSIATVKRQGIYFFIAYVAMFVVAQVPVHFMRRLAPWAYVVAVGLLVLVIFYGVGAKGAQRWAQPGRLPLSAIRVDETGHARGHRRLSWPAPPAAIL